jgi:GntR family transcriptional regulator/MocR family aminotransferase
MRILLDRQSETSLYQQIYAHFRQGILSGSLPPETRLPSTRQLARDLGINRITVETAYGDLEADGLVISRVGSGTFVLPPGTQIPIPIDEHDGPWPLWQRDVQASEDGLSQMPSEELLRGSRHPDTIAFAGGIGDPRLFPVDDYRKAIQAVLRRDGMAALEYGERSGYAPLRGTIAHVLASQGIVVRAENILITAGSQQALTLVCQLLLRPGDTILVETPTYAGALDLFRLFHLKVVGIPVDEHGMQVEKLEKLLQNQHPKLLYTIPNFHNPTGTCLSTARRRLLLGLADRYNVPILEDDFVGDLRYDGRTQPALKSLDPGGRVIYTSTFSKMLMPGLRVGFLAVEGPVYDSLVNTKRIVDLATSNLHQRAVEAYVTVGSYQAHLRRTCQVYRKRRDAMLLAVHRHLPGGVRVDPPQGGLFMWLGLPEHISAAKLLPLAAAEGVTFTPGSPFFPHGPDGDSYLRLNFAMQPPEAIDEGMMRLGKAIRTLENLK